MPSDTPLPALKQFNKNQELLLFLKYYDPYEKRLNHCGLIIANIDSKIGDIVIKPFLFCENGNTVELLSNFNDIFKKTADCCQIIIFQKLYRDQ